MSTLVKRAAHELCIPVVPTLVTITPPEQKVKIPRRLRHAFKDYAIEDWCQRLAPTDRQKARHALMILEVHHIVPRFLGGGNDFPNLALVEPTTHKLIHQDIDSKIIGMKHGDQRVIDLPTMPMQLVWGLNKTALLRWRHINSEQRRILQEAIASAPTPSRPCSGTPIPANDREALPFAA